MNQPLRFGPFRLDPRRGLWRGSQEVRLPPKALALLTVLTQRAGEIVSKDEMLRAVWPETVVSDTALTSCIQELRHALNDDARAPRYIETRHRRGYRFIARTLSARTPPSPSLPHHAAGRRSSPTMVGRERERAQLRAWLARAREGERQIVFVAGEPGIGKTTLVEAFLAAAAAHPVRIGRGQCVEHYGAGEAYLPVFDALARLARMSDGDRVVQTLATHAPTWLAQMPFLVGGSEQEALQRRVQGATRLRMLRELTDALEMLALEAPVVLSLEDLHWSDASTLDWLAFLGRRPDRAQLMVVGTYRPEEILARQHPLEAVKNDLQVHRLCRELRLDPLSEADVARYVARRLRGRSARAPATTEALIRLIQARSDGNPLFMVTVVEDLIARLEDRRGSDPPQEEMTIEVPRDVRSMIVQQHRRLGAADRRVLEAASVVGTEFTVPTVAASAGIGGDDVESSCAGLAERGQFLVARGCEEWPDATIAPRYAFLHALHREVLYEQVPVGRRARLHERVGLRLEAGWSGRASEIAAALAMHFERAGSTSRAVHYLHEAGTNAVRRNAPAEAITHLTRAIELLGTLHDTARPEQELPLQIALGSQLMAIKGWGAPDVERAYGRAHRLALQAGDAPRRFQALWGLWLYHWGRGELAQAHARGEELLALAEREGDRTLLLQAHHALWPTLFCRGAFRDVLDHAERGTALYEPDVHGGLAPVYGNHDAGVCARMFGGRAQALCGVPGGVETSDAALALARRLGQPFSEALALYQGAAVHQFLGDVNAVWERAEAAIALARTHDFRLPLAAGTALLGWAIARHEDPPGGVARIREGMGLAQASGSDLFRPYYLALLAEAHAMAGSAADGLAAVAEGLGTTARTGARFWDAELYRIRGQLLQLHTRDGAAVPAEREGDAPDERSPGASLARAVEIARAQAANALEARALAELRRLEEGGEVAHGR